ncbi:MAG TPA: DUF4328 domain-containing protein, partial [Pyrinomonadaceae bacterium]
YIVVAFFSIVTTLFGLAADPIVLAAGDGADEQLTLNDLLMLLVGLGAFLVYVALVVAFLMWLHRASKNVPALGNPKSAVEHSPGWAVGSFFVPFVNLVVPYKAVREVWVKSDPAVRAGDDFMFAQPSSAPLLLGWWVTWIVSNVASNISLRLHAGGETPDTQGFVAGVDIVSDVLGIVAAALAILVVRGIDRRQAERASHVAYVPHTPPPPPVFTQHAPQGADAPRGPGFDAGAQGRDWNT